MDTPTLPTSPRREDDGIHADLGGRSKRRRDRFGSLSGGTDSARLDSSALPKPAYWRMVQSRGRDSAVDL